MEKLEIPNHNSMLFNNRRRLRTKLQESIGGIKFIVSGAAVVALLSCMLILIIRQNIEIASMQSQLESATNHRTKRDIEMEKPLQHRVAKRSAEITPSSSVGGVVYTRWGRIDCSEQGRSTLIYSGMGAGSYYAHTGGGANLICLHGNISYYNGEYINGLAGTSHIYGLEWRDGSWINSLFDLRDTMDGSITYHTVPCALCMAGGRLGKVTIHGKRDCPEGWIHEYDGYLMAAGHSDKHSGEYICVDRRPQVVPGTQGDQKGSFLQMVETDCHSFLCEPIVRGREIRCVVCTI